jgi:hypothetical protein
MPGRCPPILAPKTNEKLGHMTPLPFLYTETNFLLSPPVDSVFSPLSENVSTAKIQHAVLELWPPARGYPMSPSIDFRAF